MRAWRWWVELMDRREPPTARAWCEVRPPCELDTLVAEVRR